MSKELRYQKLKGIERANACESRFLHCRSLDTQISSILSFFFSKMEVFVS